MRLILGSDLADETRFCGLRLTPLSRRRVKVELVGPRARVGRRLKLRLDKFEPVLSAFARERQTDDWLALPGIWHEVSQTHRESEGFVAAVIREINLLDGVDERGGE